MQRVLIIGRITKDLELKTTQSGKSVLEFSIATSEKINGQDVATFINCVAWEKAAENIARYSLKGDMIYLEGKIRNEKYTDKEGKNKYRTYIVINQFNFLPNKREKKEESTPLYEPPQEEPTFQIEESELPFY